MVDEFRSIKENIFKILAGRSEGEADRESDDYDSASIGLGIDAGAAKALLAAVFARAGKGKDEVVQIVAREIGLAVAAMLKEPLAQLAKHQRLQISFEFVPKEGHKVAAEATAKKRPHRVSPKRSPRRRKPEP